MKETQKLFTVEPYVGKRWSVRQNGVVVLIFKGEEEAKFAAEQWELSHLEFARQELLSAALEAERQAVELATKGSHEAALKLREFGQWLERRAGK